MNPTVDDQVALLMQGCEFGDPQIERMMAGELRERLLEGRPLRVYCGYDATRPDLHLGHTITMGKLRQFQELGHEVTFVIGDFTTRIGDPSDKSSLRPQIPVEEIERNARTYAEQAFRILDPARTHVRFNSEWLDRLTFADVIRLASHFTVQQFLARENFQARLAANAPLWLHELVYTLAQGYDAVALQADVQIGGTEQLFSLLAGRKLQEAMGQRPQVCITFPILLGTDGHTRMSKSAGNYIGITEPPEEMYGKVMSIPDSALRNYATLVTRWAPGRVAEFLAGLEAGPLHPMEAKKALAWEIVDRFHGSEAADAAARSFARLHQERQAPDEMAELRLTQAMPLADLLVVAGMCHSKSEARRLVAQGGVRLDGQPVTAADGLIEPRRAVLQVGKRRFLRLVPYR